MRRRRGVALLLVLVALVATAAMSAGVLLSSRMETRTAADSWAALRAAEAAERGVVQAAASWIPESSLTILPGARMGPLLSSYPDSTSSSAWITRLTGGSFWVTAQGRMPVTGVAAPIGRTVGALYVMHLPQPDSRATVSVRDSLIVTGAAAVDGNDTAPWGTLCAPPGPAIAGAAAPDTGRIQGSGIAGTPPVIADPLAGHASTFARLGAVSWTSLAARATERYATAATVTPGARLTNGACDATASGNWGDPSRVTPCANRFVIVHAAGSLIIDGGAGQGVILAETDVLLRNGAQFFGLVLARGHITVTGAASLWGAAVAGATASVGGTSRLTYSSCALERALVATAPLRREKLRSWAVLP